MATIVVVREYGGPEVLTVETAEVPTPGPGEVKLEVKAIGVNPIDLKNRTGVNATPLPYRPGAEAAGVVIAVGDGVVGVAVGDEVIAYRAAGAYASELIVPVADVVPKPASISWEEAAGLMLVGSTAVHALEKVRVGEGDVVLAHGVAGGVGQSLLQLAALRGATVIGTASPGSFDLIRELGGVPVAYGEGLLDRVREIASTTGPVTAAIDLVGTEEAIDVSLAIVEDHSRVTTIVGGAYPTSRGIQKIGGGPGADPGTEIRDAARATLAQLAGEGRLRTRVFATFPLAEAAKAHELVAEGHAKGKVVLIP